MSSSVYSNSRLLRATILFGLLTLQTPELLAETESRVIASYNRSSQSAVPFENVQTPSVDQKVLAASHESKLPATTPAENANLLTRPSRSNSTASTNASDTRTIKTPAFALPKIESFTTAGAGLGIVVGLFLVCMFLLRKSGPKPSSPLPNEAVAVLGRVPLAARNFAHLLKVGNKLVLVAITPDGVTPITEVTDPAEVQHLLGLCLSNKKSSNHALV